MNIKVIYMIISIFKDRAQYNVLVQNKFSVDVFCVSWSNFTYPRTLVFAQADHLKEPKDFPPFPWTPLCEETVPDWSRQASRAGYIMAANSRLQFSTAKFAILGGGISGLSAAFYLAKKLKDPGNITVLESGSRLGGWMKSVTTNEGATFEQGPRGMRPAGGQGLATLNMVSVHFYRHQHLT